eukprot:9310464-Pyramimonas_sp.AAC.1
MHDQLYTITLPVYTLVFVGDAWRPVAHIYRRVKCAIYNIGSCSEWTRSRTPPRIPTAKLIHSLGQSTSL